MEMIYQLFIGSDASLARPSYTDPPLLSYMDILIGAAALIGIVGCVLIFRFLHRKWKNRQLSHITSAVLPSKKKVLHNTRNEYLHKRFKKPELII